MGLTTDSLTVVEKGLAAGETVIVDGLDRLRDGSTVSVAASVDTPKAEAVPVLPAQQRESAGSKPAAPPLLHKNSIVPHLTPEPA